MNQFVKATGAAVAVVAIVLSLQAMGSAREVGNQADTAGREASTARSLSSSTVSQVGGLAAPRELSQETIARIRSEGTTIAPANGTNQLTDVLPIEEILAAAHPGKAQDPTLEASLGFVTISGYGRELEADPNRPSRLDLFVEDRLAWVVRTHAEDIPLISQPMSVAMAEDSAKTYSADMFIVYDARTGEFLSAETM